jgi:hypothetical protein
MDQSQKSLADAATASPAKLQANNNLAASQQRRGSAAATIESTINDVFLNEGHAKRALADNMRLRALDGQTIRARAELAFQAFSASKYTPGDRAKPNYSQTGMRLDTGSVKTIVSAGLDRLAASADRRTLRIRETEAFTALIDGRAAPAGMLGTVALGDLLAYTEDRLDMLPAERPRPITSPCEAEKEAESWLRTMEQGGTNSTPDTSQPDNSAPTDLNSTEPPSDSSVNSFIDRQVTSLMAKVAAPETQVQFEVPGRQRQADIAEALQTFELRSGPSDVTSYHDFSSLQIAFQHIWTEIFDGQLAPLGKELYYEYVKLKTSLGVDDGTDRTIDTLDDLAQLMGEIRDLATIKSADTPPALQDSHSSDTGGSISGATIAQGIKQTTLGGIVAGATGSDLAGAIVDPGGWAIGKIAQALAGKPTLTWDSFETPESGEKAPLPIEGDRIQVGFEADAVPAGQVEIVIANTKDTWWWKGIDFYLLGLDGQITSTKRVATDVDNVKGWNPSKTDRLQIATGDLRTGVLEFIKDAPRGIGGWPTGFYKLTGLDAKLTDRMRATFTWIKD